jgi:hypothetical protein
MSTATMTYARSTGHPRRLVLDSWVMRGALRSSAW